MAQIIQSNRGSYLLCDTDHGHLRSERDILDLLGLFWEVGANLLLISEGVLHPDFFDLSTRVAGEIVLKLSNYRVKTVIVVDLDSIPSQPFREWAGECNRGKEIHFCQDRDEAEGWLLENES